MADQLSKEQAINLEDVVISSSYEISAMFNILERKGLITREEVVEEVKRIREELGKVIEVYK
jgi:hypothetical protein